LADFFNGISQYRSPAPYPPEAFSELPNSGCQFNGSADDALLDQKVDDIQARSLMPPLV
jgi:hypothetical protein